MAGLATQGRRRRISARRRRAKAIRGKVGSANPRHDQVDRLAGENRFGRNDNRFRLIEQSWHLDAGKRYLSRGELVLRADVAGEVLSRLRSLMAATRLGILSQGAQTAVDRFAAERANDKAPAHCHLGQQEQRRYEEPAATLHASTNCNIGGNAANLTKVPRSQRETRRFSLAIQAAAPAGSLRNRRYNRKEPT